MNREYCEKIDKLRSEIELLNNSLSDVKVYSESPKREKASDDPEYRSFALKKFQSTYNYKTFKRREKAALRALSSKYSNKVEHIENMDIFMDNMILEEMRGVSKWINLNKWQRNNRILDYLDRYMRESGNVIDVDKHITALLKLKTKDVEWKDGEIVCIKCIEDYL